MIVRRHLELIRAFQGDPLGERITYISSGTSSTRLILDPEDVDNPILAFFLTNWRKQRSAVAIPPAASFSLDQAGAHKEWVMITEAMSGYADFRFRFIGEKFAGYFIGEGNGKTLSEAFGNLAPANLEATISIFRLACTDAVPVRVTSPKGEVNGLGYSDIDGLYLPYASADGKPGTVVTVYTFNYDSFRSSRSITALLSGT